MDTHEEVLSIPEKIQEWGRKHFTEALLIPEIERKMSMRVMQAGQQSMNGKNDFERKIQQQSILDRDPEYQTLLGQLKIAKESKDAAALEVDYWINKMRAWDIYSRLVQVK
ncbi:MAG: hypothetical protein WC451_02615 [Patescibacteria group bacterium]